MISNSSRWLFMRFCTIISMESLRSILISSRLLNNPLIVKFAEPVKDVILSPSLNWPDFVWLIPCLFFGLMIRISIRLLYIRKAKHSKNWLWYSSKVWRRVSKLVKSKQSMIPPLTPLLMASLSSFETIWLMTSRILPPFEINEAKPSASTLIVAELK